MNQAAPWAGQFGLTQNPFKDNIDTGLFFRTGQHEDAALKIRIGLEDKHAVILLSGTSGTGKTLVSQVALRAMHNSRYQPVLVLAYPGMSRAGLLAAILAELNVAAARFVHDRLQQIQDEALELHRRRRRLVIIIDEAHFLRADALHILRTLSNLETEREKLVTVLLVAEQSLIRRLRAPSYAALRGRITFAITLMPLDRNDLEQYIKYRLLKCGGAADILSPAVYDLLYEKSGGIPRAVNRLLYGAFIEALAAGHDGVGVAMVAVAAQKLAAING
ncbi:MAG: AAA family ATPase [Deltaproteobacteria bacterium]|nr:AAA family ATPase [Deltaproteobacteria bacterium]